MSAPLLTLTYSIADQNFAQTKSLGILNLSVELLEALAVRPELSRLTVLSNASLDERLDLPPNVGIRRYQAPVRGKLGRIIWDQWGVYSAARRVGHEWLFLPKGFASFARSCPVKLALYVHDAVHDYYRRHYPRSVPRFEQLYFERCFRANLRSARLIVTNSDFSSAEVRRLAEAHGIEPPEVITIGMGFTPVPRTQAPKEDRIVVLTTRWPHKRAELAVEFFARWQRQTAYSGRIDWLGSFPAGLHLPNFPNWRRSGRLSDAEFHDLLNRAKVLAYFSAYEGFGMPPVEAVTAGTCPVYSSLPATREVMRDCGHAFDNISYESFAAALEKALAESPARLEEWARELLGRHNWNRTTLKLLEALRRCG